MTYLQTSIGVGQVLILDKPKESHGSKIIFEKAQLQGSDGEVKRKRKRDTEQQMNAEAVEHLDRQISCYARDPPQGTSG